MRRLLPASPAGPAEATAEPWAPRTGPPDGDPDRREAYEPSGAGSGRCPLSRGCSAIRRTTSVLLGRDQRILDAGARFTDTFLAGEEPDGRDFLELLDSGSRQKARAFLHAATTVSCTAELDLRVGLKGIRLVNFTFCPIPIPGATAIIAAIGRDQEEPLALVQQVVEVNQELEAARRELEFQALTDPLTGLGNRRWLFEQLDVLWASADRSGQLSP